MDLARDNGLCDLASARWPSFLPGLTRVLPTAWIVDVTSHGSYCGISAAAATQGCVIRSLVGSLSLVEGDLLVPCVTLALITPSKSRHEPADRAV